VFLHPLAFSGDDSNVSSRPFRGYLALQGLAMAIYPFLPGDGWMHVVWQVAIGWIAAVSVVIGMRGNRPPGAVAWYLFGGGVLMNSTGILVAAILLRVYHIDEQQSPMLADAFWLCLYPGLVVGMGMLVRRRTLSRDWSTLVDTVTISTGLGLLSWVLIIRPQAIDPRLHLVARATVAAYPVSDLVVLAMILRLVIGGGIRGISFRLMIGALVGFLGTDIGWALYSNLGLDPPAFMQRILELGSLTGFALVGAASLHPTVCEVALPAPPRQARLSPVLLAGLTVASLIAPAVLIVEAVRRKITDGVAIGLSSAVLFSLVVTRMAQLLRRVEQRTAELDERNRSVRRVLDTINEGLLTVGPDGVLAEERSAIIDRWFGAWRGPVSFADYVRPVDEDFAASFELGLEALRDGYLPTELCLAQLPARLRHEDRHFQVSYLPITDQRRQHALLVVINDVTAQVALARQDAEQRELLALLQSFSRDRAGFLAFFDEANQIVETAVWAGQERATQRRLIHTLKGNAALAGLQLLAELCHRAEGELEDLPQMSVTPGILALRSRWLELAQSFRALVGDGSRELLEVRARDIDQLCADLEGGLPPAQVAARLRSWRCEPVEQSLQRLAEHARELARELGKGEVEIEISGGDLRLDARRWGPVWAEMVHVVRNAVDHGLEHPDERRAADKPVPRLRFEASAQGSVLTICIADDGRGIDWSALERAAAARGLAPSDRLALLTSGVSSRTEVSTISGRGLGMSAVGARVRAFSGTVEVDSHPGRGTRWTFSFPLSPASAAA
jgi:HPt (histidine-containing phosphotransfer) domain-containing protein